MTKKNLEWFYTFGQELAEDHTTYLQGRYFDNPPVLDWEQEQQDLLVATQSIGYLTAVSDYGNRGESDRLIDLRPVQDSSGTVWTPEKCKTGTEQLFYLSTLLNQTYGITTPGQLDALAHTVLIDGKPVPKVNPDDPGHYERIVDRGIRRLQQTRMAETSDLLRKGTSGVRQALVMWSWAMPEPDIGLYPGAAQVLREDMIFSGKSFLDGIQKSKASLEDYRLQDKKIEPGDIVCIATPTLGSCGFVPLLQTGLKRTGEAAISNRKTVHVGIMPGESQKKYNIFQRRNEWATLQGWVELLKSRPNGRAEFRDIRCLMAAGRAPGDTKESHVVKPSPKGTPGSP